MEQVQVCRSKNLEILGQHVVRAHGAELHGANVMLTVSLDASLVAAGTFASGGTFYPSEECVLAHSLPALIEVVSFFLNSPDDTNSELTPEPVVK
jgi:hypothetical protein